MSAYSKESLRADSYRAYIAAGYEDSKTLTYTNNVQNIVNTNQQRVNSTQRSAKEALTNANL